MNGPTLELIEGTTFAFDLTWSDSSGTPVDLTGCVARFAICPALSNRPLASCSTADGGIVIGGAAGTVAVSLTPGQTAGQYSESWKGARYELRVEYAGGEVYSLLRGLVAMTPAVLE